jgi:hypothetical protein
MTDFQTSEVDAKLAPINLGPCNSVCWQVFEGWTRFIQSIFVENQEYESGGRLNVNIQHN